MMDDDSVLSRSWKRERLLHPPRALHRHDSEEAQAQENRNHVLTLELDTFPNSCVLQHI
jgi:hypothetical protein